MALASIHFFCNFLWHLALSNSASTAIMNQWIVKLLCNLKFWKWIESTFAATFRSLFWWLAHKDGIAFSFQCPSECKSVSRGWPARQQGRVLKTCGRLSLPDQEFCMVDRFYVRPQWESCEMLQRRCEEHHILQKTNIHWLSGLKWPALPTTKIRVQIW